MQNKQAISYMKDALWPLSVGAVGVAYLCGPMLRFVTPDTLLIMCLFSTAGLSFLYSAVDSKFGSQRCVLSICVAGVSLFVAGVYLRSALDEAQKGAAAADIRCLAIQRDMLSAHRRMVDGPTVFQALGCRPQGQGMIRVPPTDRELRAKRALKDGGYMTHAVPQKPFRAQQLSEALDGLIAGKPA